MEDDNDAGGGRKRKIATGGEPLNHCCLPLKSEDSEPIFTKHLQRYFIEVDDGSDEDMDPENADEADAAVAEKRIHKTKRATHIELNKRARRKEQLRKETELKKIERLSKEIDSLPDILQEIEKEDEEKNKRHIRQVVAKQERLKSFPPRLGKHKFQPAPMQVLLSKEITRSLRKIKACSTLAKDRFKSLEKRGLIAPTGRTRSHVEPFKNEVALEQDAERKIGWLLKLFFAGTATFVGYQFFPYMGDNLIQQSVSLLHVKDPMFKRMGASRLARFAIDDERRMKVVEMGGAKELCNMLEGAKDDRTRKEALKALLALSHSGQAAAALHNAGAITIIRSTPDSVEDVDVGKCNCSLLQRFQDLKYDVLP